MYCSFSSCINPNAGNCSIGYGLPPRQLPWTKNVPLTETWLSTTIYNKEILPSNFCIYRSDRPSRGGGAMICVSNSISSRLIASHSDIDLVIVQLLTSPCVILCCVYIPPNCSSSYFCSAISILETILTQHNHVIILGDFNLPDINWSSLTFSIFYYPL